MLIGRDKETQNAQENSQRWSREIKVELIWDWTQVLEQIAGPQIFKRFLQKVDRGASAWGRAHKHLIAKVRKFKKV